LIEQFTANRQVLLAEWSDDASRRVHFQRKEKNQAQGPGFLIQFKTR